MSVKVGGQIVSTWPPAPVILTVKPTEDDKEKP